MTHKDGSISCDFCGRPESRTTVLVAGQNDAHICDCCAWDCAMLVYEEIKDRFWGESPQNIVEKPFPLALYTFADTPENTNDNEEDEK